ncbi:hypothetical protein GCM10007880_31010 [Mesorhizobium amorphae]|nr:hypothetical protein GCM10007880_31010 [Mesorhizobium amorphae]
MNPHDHGEILGDDVIIRRVNPAEHVYFDENHQVNRLSTKVMQPSSEPKGGMSIDHEPTLVEMGIDPRAFVTSPPMTASVWLRAGAAREIGLQVGYDPIDPHNMAHCEVWGPIERPNRFSKGQQRKLLATSEWYVELPGVVVCLADSGQDQ